MCGKKRSKKQKAATEESSTAGRWTAEEHTRFLEALELYGKNWKLVQTHVGTRTTTQARSHAQKHFAKLAKGHSAPGSTQASSFPASPVCQPLTCETPIKSAPRGGKRRFAEVDPAEGPARKAKLCEIELPRDSPTATVPEIALPPRRAAEGASVVSMQQETHHPEPVAKWWNEDPNFSFQVPVYNVDAQPVSISGSGSGSGHGEEIVVEFREEDEQEEESDDASEPLFQNLETKVEGPLDLFSADGAEASRSSNASPSTEPSFLVDLTGVLCPL